MNIDNSLISYLEKLARIELSDVEREKLTKDIGDIVSYMDTLSELDTEGVEPLSHCLPVSNVWREDEVKSGDTHSEILRNAPRKTDSCFVVPRVVE